MRRIAGRRDAGALTLSYVMIVPLFLAGIMTIVQASVWYLARQAALGAARQGADAARLLGAAPGAGPRTALAFARSAAPGYLLGPAADSVGSTATTIVVTVRGGVPSLIPLVHISVQQSASVPVEKFTTPARAG
jgi:Flp pilus assembly protein TadG